MRIPGKRVDKIRQAGYSRRKSGLLFVKSKNPLKYERFYSWVCVICEKSGVLAEIACYQ